ncbi:copper resistance D family protein [Xylanimonas allomyrinae]|uniref:copper resistance D family protein n=1 Tax=Xylanimonas allomyrinae TaxID=2509459 RepID=UPI0024829268|nr:CopD family protein [Xylanimonas allomyrinae]
MTVRTAPAEVPAADRDRRARWLVVAGPAAVVVALASALGAGAFTGAFAALAEFTDVGAVVRWGLPVLDVTTGLASALTLGALVTAAALVGPGRWQRTALTTAGAAAAVWALAGVAGLVLQYADISATRLDATGFGEGLWQFLTEIELGRTGLAIVILAAVTSAMALASTSAVGALWTCVAPLAAFAYQASTGHAAGAASHSLAVGAMTLHLVGAALWVGGLGAIGVLVLAAGRTRPAGTPSVGAASEPHAGSRGKPGAEPSGPDGWEAAVPRYSHVASWCLVAVGFSGVVSAWIRVGNLGDLGSRYGLLLVVKAVLLAGLGALGWAHRRRVLRDLGLLAPDAGSGGPQARGPARRRPALLGPARAWAFARLAAVELIVMGAVMGVAVGLAASAPPVPDDVPVDTSPAYQLTGSPLPPELTGARWFTEWRLDPLSAFACAAAVVVYVVWTRRLARRGDRWPVGRTVAWCLGMAVIAWDTNGGRRSTARCCSAPTWCSTWCSRCWCRCCWCSRRPSRS